MSRFLNPQDLLKNTKNSNKNSRSKSRGSSNNTICNYEIFQKIGQGSYAKVYKAIHNLTNQMVAVKVFNKQKMSKQDIQSVYKQVDIHKKLIHTNIVRIYEFYQNQTKIYLFMEYCHNGELFNYINSNGALTQKFASKIFKQILSALKYLKSQRVFHRDIKCQNILFDKNWNAKLVDFGFSTKQQQGSFSQTFCGSPSYTAPQLAKKQKYKSQMVDIWCLGVTLYAMLMSRLPFDQKQDKDTRKNIMEMKYQFKRNISSQAKQVLNLIFTDMNKRASIQDLQQSEFVRNGQAIKVNFIDSNIEQIVIDSYVIELLQDQFEQLNSSQIIQSVTQFKLDSNYAFYYLKVQNMISKGQKVKSDINSPNFEKIKKKPNKIRLRRLSQDFRKIKSDKTIDDMNIFQLIEQKSSLKQRLKLPSINIQTARRNRRDNYTPESPKRILDYVSAYRIRD